MKTIDLYLSVLKDIRYRILSNENFKLQDFEQDSKGYELLANCNEAANKLTDLISIMEYEKELK